MSQFDMQGLYVADYKDYRHYYPCGMNILEKLWWLLMPGVIIQVSWPADYIVVTQGHPSWSGNGPTWEEYYSTDPNDHYRPWLEENVGRQGWDWNWGLASCDAVENRLTIKFRKKYAAMATLAVMRWS